MITALFLKLTDYPFFRRLVWKPVYNALAKRFTVRDWSFMNYGYTPFPYEAPLSLDAADEINRYPIQLYHYLAAKAELSGKEVLEVGSGRGGGAWHLKKYLRPKRMTGLDIAGNAIQLARKHYPHEDLQFVQGSAEQLPFPDASFDVVLNIESSHTYGSVPLFLSEVERVLRPGGCLLLADIRVRNDMDILKQQLHSSAMQLLEEEDISRNVQNAIEAEEPIKKKRIEEHVPSYMRGLFEQFSGVVGSKAHKDLSSGALVYYRFVLQKHTTGV